jgi:hypothetical protein
MLRRTEGLFQFGAAHFLSVVPNIDRDREVSGFLVFAGALGRSYSNHEF